MRIDEAKTIYKRIKTNVIDANNTAQFWRVQVLKEVKRRLGKKIKAFEQQNKYENHSQGKPYVSL